MYCINIDLFFKNSIQVAGLLLVAIGGEWFCWSASTAAAGVSPRGAVDG